MKKISLLALIVIVSLLSTRAHAQTQAPSLKNTNWKIFIADASDTLTLHIKSDSSYVTNGAGEAVVRSLCKTSADTLFLTDYDGQYACPNATGKYKINLADDGSTLTLLLIEDPCDGRANAINKAKWMRAAASPMK